MRRAKSKFPGWLVLSIGVAIAAVAISFATIDSSPRTVAVTGNDFVDVEAPIQPGAVEFFAWQDKAGSRIRFLLARTEDGGVKTAFDACSRCFSYRQGYSSSNGYLVCRLCGTRYRVGEKMGMASCAPVDLPASVNGTRVRIKTDDLEHARSMF
jgi:uncharacterized membrane protein